MYPAGHTSQTLFLEPCENEPSGQSSAAELPSPQNVPAGQGPLVLVVVGGAAEVDPFSQKYPFEHGPAGSTSPWASQYIPGVHGMQPLALWSLLRFEKLPGGQAFGSTEPSSQ